MPYGSAFNRNNKQNGKNKEDGQNDSFDNCFAISDSAGPFHSDDSHVKKVSMDHSDPDFA